MTVTAADVAKVSIYSVSDAEGSILTNTLFESYRDDAAEILDQISPGVPERIYDRCHALLIAHFYALKLGQIEMRSKETGDVVWVQPGKTGYWVQCMDLIEEFKQGAPVATISAASSKVTRADSGSSLFRLDQSTPTTYWDGDT